MRQNLLNRDTFQKMFCNPLKSIMDQLGQGVASVPGVFLRDTELSDLRSFLEVWEGALANPGHLNPKEVEVAMFQLW